MPDDDKGGSVARNRQEGGLGGELGLGLVGVDDLAGAADWN